MKPTSRRHTVQAAALFVAPIAGLTTTLLWPETPLDPAERLQVLADAGVRMEFAHLANLVTILAFVPAILGMLRLLDGRKPRFRAIGAALTTLGLIGWTGILAFGVVEVQTARLLDPRAAVTLIGSLQASVLGIAFTGMFLLCFFAGLIVLAIGMWRARMVPGWVPAAVGLAVVIDLVASTFTIAVVAVWLLQCAAWARTGLALASPRRERTSVPA